MAMGQVNAPRRARDVNGRTSFLGQLRLAACLGQEDPHSPPGTDQLEN